MRRRDLLSGMSTSTDVRQSRATPSGGQNTDKVPALKTGDLVHEFVEGKCGGDRERGGRRSVLRPTASLACNPRGATRLNILQLGLLVGCEERVDLIDHLRLNRRQITRRGTDRLRGRVQGGLINRQRFDAGEPRLMGCANRRERRHHLRLERLPDLPYLRQLCVAQT